MFHNIYNSNQHLFLYALFVDYYIKNEISQSKNVTYYNNNIIPV